MKIVSFVRAHIIYFLLTPMILYAVGISISVLKPVSNQQSTFSVDSTVLLNEFETLLKESEGDRLIKLQPRLREFIDILGIDLVMNGVKKGLADNSYNINDCHRVLHLVGHFAYTANETDIVTLARKDANLCGHAYQHGIEAQISLTSSDPVADLHAFCGAMQNTQPGYVCYHGVGHEQMLNTLDVEKSLASCDQLGLNSPTSDLSDCYNGVFSEYAFQLEGVDGDTGTPFPGGPELVSTFKNPLDYCMSVNLKYQSSCAAQLSRILLDDSTAEIALSECLQDIYPVFLQAGCIRNVIAVIAQGILATDIPLSVHRLILDESVDIKNEYIAGAAGEYRALRHSGVQKDFLYFCNSFTEETDKNECKSSLEI